MGGSRVVLVSKDTDEAWRVEESLKANGWSVVSYATAASLVGEHQFHEKDMLVIDAMTNGVPGGSLLAVLRKRGIDLPAVVLIAPGSVSQVVRWMRDGAVDCFEKPADAVHLQVRLEELARAHDGRIAAEGAVDMARYETLSPREREVMMLVSRGLMNKQIADELDISAKTVEMHRGRVMKKMQVVSLAHLVRAAVRLEAHSGDQGAGG